MKAENNECKIPTRDDLINSYIDPKLQVRVTKTLQKGLESGKAEVVFDKKGFSYAEILKLQHLLPSLGYNVSSCYGGNKLSCIAVRFSPRGETLWQSIEY